MNFQSIKPIEDYQFFLDLAFRRAREKGEKLRSTKLRGGRLEKSNYIELMKMQVIVDTISMRMDDIIRSFPNLDDLDEFYAELLRISLDYAQLKKSLGAINWLGTRSKHMFRIFRSKLEKNKNFDNINKIKGEFLGRLSSMVKQVKKDFTFLEYARRVLKDFPVVKTGLRTVAIAGFPNVGKTTLLYHLTGSKGEINSYPFTTKGVNIGFIGKGKSRLQLLDTPGTLDRFEKMNSIEQVAYLAIKHCAEFIVYVFDPTCEYPMAKQEKLFKKLKKDFGKEIIVFVSKKDLVEKDEYDDINDKFHGVGNKIKGILEKKFNSI